jgi:hypothetical protein
MDPKDVAEALALHDHARSSDDLRLVGVQRKLNQDTSYHAYHATAGDSQTESESDSQNPSSSRKSMLKSGYSRISTDTSVSWFALLVALFKDNISRYVPATVWLREYTRDSFVSDLLAGLTVGFFTVPQGAFIVER